MATIKSFTDLEQSRKLAEILPLESADMEYLLEQWMDETGSHKEGYYEIPVIKVDENSPLQQITHPCWSLAALLNFLPYPILCKKSDNTWGVDLWVDNKLYCTYASYKIDACYEMIIHLHELNLL